MFLITSYSLLFELCKEKLDVDKLPGAERVKSLILEFVYFKALKNFPNSYLRS